MLTPDEKHLDRRIAQEAASLAARGWSVDIFPAVDPGLLYGGEPSPGVRLMANPRPQVRAGMRTRVLRRLRRQLAPVTPALDRLIEAGRYRLNDRAGALANANSAHLLALKPYDLVFAHDVPMFPLAARLKDAWDCGLICDLHEVYPEQDEHFTTATARRYWRSIEHEGIGNADGIICVNDAVADYVHTRYAPRATTVVVHNSMPHMEPRELRGRTVRDHYPIAGDSRVMLFAGSLGTHANLETVIRGFAAAQLEGWVLALLGDGPMRGRLEELVRRQSLDGKVFLGRRAPQHELAQVISSADMGLVPYQAIGINHLVATPNKLFEYLQARLPIATSKLPMIERIVSSAHVGGFVDFSTTESTGAGLRRFVYETLPGVTHDSLEAAARRFSWEREEASLVEVVEGAMRPAQQ